MKIIKKLLGPKSKYDRTIPYTYIAKEVLIEGVDDLYAHYFADTICGLVEYLDQKNVSPEYVELFGVFKKDELKLDKNICLDEDGKWLLRPAICHSLEEYYEKTKDELYKGHKEFETCDFDDRDTQGEGPHT